ncbi:hypothetical protein BLGI_4703 [Brevibacillus laterosporus GI-9]|uniref:hypothetical protein n=1 Tax=Brevibacillus laterosporus TaxID=1465 RepID=UPI0002405250|nr:hypothetical protein [Brevibacillus laterosporus]CCF16734.1 hypothetical protein BLGI_4703 [Brevibacillus laterosporus GI-9]
MEEQRLHHSSVRDVIETLLETEKIIVNESFIKYFLHVLSRLCNYEEEGQKIRPRLIVSNNITEAIKTVSNSHLIKTRVGIVDGSDMEKIVKSLIPFCNNGWHVFIDLLETEIHYGVIRSFSGPIGLTISENLFNVDDLELVDYAVVEVKAISNFELHVCGLRKSSLTIDSRYLELEGDRTVLFPRMIEDITSALADPRHKEIVSKAFDNLFRVIPYKIHGTICVVVESDYTPGDFLADGIWFENPIDLGEKVIDSVINKKDIVSAEEFYGLSGLFLEMLNVDGMTILDTSAKVRGFNIFVRKVPEGIVVPNEGGARKRAANTVLLSGESKIVGVYFLSQDGNSFYKRVGEQ